MKTNYLQPNSKKKGNGLVRAVKTIVVFLAVVFALHFISPNLFVLPTGLVTSPLSDVRVYLSSILSRSFTWISFKNNLIAENENLRDEVETLRLEVLNLKARSLESESLDRFRAQGGSGSMVARVIAKPPQSPYDVLVLEVGQDQGANIGSKVWSRDILIGRVIEVSGKLSKVALFSSPGETTDVELIRNGLSFSLNGRGGGNFELSLPSSVDITVGDIFVAPGIRSFIIAKVDAIESKETDSFKKLFLSVPLNLYSLQWVEVEGQ